MLISVFSENRLSFWKNRFFSIIEFRRSSLMSAIINRVGLMYYASELMCALFQVIQCHVTSVAPLQDGHDLSPTAGRGLEDLFYRPWGLLGLHIGSVVASTLGACLPQASTPQERNTLIFLNRDVNFVFSENRLSFWKNRFFSIIEFRRSSPMNAIISRVGLMLR